jgi:hypothetical protein
MKFLALFAFLASVISCSVFADTSVRCTSDSWEIATDLKFDYKFSLETRRDYQDKYIKNAFELIPGMAVLVEARKKNEDSDVEIKLTVGKVETYAWKPYAGASGKNAVVIYLNANSLATKLDYSKIPEKKITESAQSYKEKVVDALKNQEKSSLEESFRKQFGDLVTINCRVL